MLVTSKKAADAQTAAILRKALLIRRYFLVVATLAFIVGALIPLGVAAETKCGTFYFSDVGGSGCWTGCNVWVDGEWVAASGHFHKC